VSEILILVTGFQDQEFSQKFYESLKSRGGGGLDSTNQILLEGRGVEMNPMIFPGPPIQFFVL